MTTQGAPSFWSIPKLAPTYTPFPITLDDVLILTTVYRTNLEDIKRHIDPPVEPTGDVVMIHNYQFPVIPGVGHGQETNVMFGVKVLSNGKEHRGGFTTNLLINHDVGMAHGREVHGQPKKLGTTNILRENGEIKVEVHRRSNLVMTLSMKDQLTPCDITELTNHFPFMTNINHKVIPNIDGTLGMNQITSRTFGDVVIKECARGKSTIQFFENEEAPFHLLPIVETIETFVWRTDFKLVPGQILHDYLANR